MLIGLYCAIFTILSILIVLAFNKKTKALFDSYFFYAITGTIAFVYFIAFRWSWDLKDWIDGNDNNYLGGMGVIKSKVLLLDLCPFLAFFLPIGMVFDKERKWIPYIGFFGIVGGSVTIFGQIAFEAVGNGAPSWANLIPNTTWWEYIFFNKLYFIMHWFIIFISVILIMNSKCLSWKSVAISHIFAIIFFSYVSIIALSLNITNNATGIVPGDWAPNGQYGVVGQIFNLPWPWQPIVCFTLVWVWVLIMMVLRNILVLDENYYNDKMIEIPYVRSFYLSLVDKVKGNN